MKRHNKIQNHTPDTNRSKQNIHRRSSLSG
jgi:hypothetical protein